MPRANGISRFLGDRCQTRATARNDRILGLEIFTAGFRTSNTDDGRVRVEYLIATRRATKRDQAADRADRIKALERYAGLLRERFTVETVTEDEWIYLIVS